VIVCEVDPMRALEARMEGFEAMPALVAAERGDVFVTVTGNRDVLSAEHFARMKDGAVLANAGHFDVEIDLRALADAATGEPREVLPLVTQYDLGDRRLNLLACGRVVNLAAGHRDNPLEVRVLFRALTKAPLQRGFRRFGRGCRGRSGADFRDTTLDVMGQHSAAPQPLTVVG
jgi:adenosylhomocysteinase